MRLHLVLQWRGRRDYRAAWAAHAAPPRFEAAGFPMRVQTEADLLAEADWALVTIPHLSFIRIGSSSSE